MKKELPTHQYWEVVDTLPEGWAEDKYMPDGPLPHSIFITNGKSPLKGQERKILMLDSYFEKDLCCNSNQDEELIEPKQSEKLIESKENTEKQLYLFPAKEFNILARKKMQEKLLKDIMTDLTICEIEGWNKAEYIKEIYKLINDIREKLIDKK